jgi:hypothetical protein
LVTDNANLWNKDDINPFIYFFFQW